MTIVSTVRLLKLTAEDAKQQKEYNLNKTREKVIGLPTAAKPSYRITAKLCLQW